MNRNPVVKNHLRRLGYCLLGGLVLALMVGNQEGTQTDFHVAFRKAWFEPRVFVFLAIGVILYLLITFWPRVEPYVGRPGMKPLGIGLIAVIGSQTIMNWYDPLAASRGSGKFNAVRSAAADTPGLPALTNAFFSWLAWTLLAVAVIGGAIVIIARVRVLGYVVGAVGVFGAVVAYVAHRDIVHAGAAPSIDHSLGVYVDMIGFLILAGAGLTTALSRRETADTRAFFRAVMDYRPGLPLVLVALVWGLFIFTTAGWFGPQGASINWTLSESHDHFAGTALSSLGTQYLSWLGWTLFAVCLVLTAAACILRHQLLAWVAGVVSLVAVLLTFLTIRSMTHVAADAAPQYGPPWKNLGVGGFCACMVFSLLVAAAALVISTARATARAQKAAAKERRLADTGAPGGSTASKDSLWVTNMVQAVRASSNLKALLILAAAIALFYPPTLTVTWQNVLVTQIGVYVLLAIGLNVVVGWAGLLDLGYIAFYEIGSYTTAYFTGSLPVKPPSWLHPFESPLWSIPFAIIACLIAGVLLGAPTLRLRGDYLAIVTLGFGEIIQVVAVNAKPFTGGPQGPTVPHPRIHIGSWHVTWGQDNLPYWYLLLIMLTVVLFLFWRLEGSRIGRAWAAIREDEVAAQASGVNTMRIKLLAFAIGASTSGLAGVFFATQVGYFDPSLFTLQASILIVAYVVFGGMGSLYGAMAGAAVLTWLPQFLKDQVPADDRQMWVGALVLAMMIFRPAGLLPARRRKAELEGLDAPASSEVQAVPSSGALT